ncbi:hypothetical protein HPP92_008757 [Vanilla planifolia]|uniref:RRM domain-containing protein n=1 Tax=Vanilla planifolia TaxID=51239 RepID=A0A835R6N4_VANPL|nr:hypothetical protein HPP92_008757 [Vanilla planifolia]
MWKLYVGNLSSRIREMELANEFRAYGLVRSVWIARNPPGYAFVEFDSRQEAYDAIAGLDGKHGWRVEMSRKSSGGNRKRSPIRDNRCRECGSRYHRTTDCGSRASRSSSRRSSSPQSRTLLSRSVSPHAACSRSRSPRDDDRYNKRQKSTEGCAPSSSPRVSRSSSPDNGQNGFRRDGHGVNEHDQDGSPDHVKCSEEPSSST